ncbi:FMN-binding protein [Anaerococcus sp. AGMB09787]|uniref:FMN-binding protein n=1 Tax=Anaerococcus sp. AGMB09787 TaxID=2922869 RepID=UPI001FAFA924|nr:FMN-binding protein [Anaerococcus sp. AGMB09787]
MTNIKKYAAVAALALALTACGNKTEEAAPADNAASTATSGEVVGEATGQGYGGEMKVTVTLDGETIKDIQVDHKETEDVGGKAVPELVEAIKAANGTDGVENVSGATVTSEALKAAVDEAIANAK